MRRLKILNRIYSASRVIDVVTSHIGSVSAHIAKSRICIKLEAYGFIGFLN